MLPEVRHRRARQRCRATTSGSVVTGPIELPRADAVQRDIDTLTVAALAGSTCADAFITAVTPMTARRSDRDILDVLPQPMQPTCTPWPTRCTTSTRPSSTPASCVQLDLGVLTAAPDAAGNAANPARKQDAPRTEVGVEIVNHALQGIPEDRVRYHHCWGSMNTPHTTRHRRCSDIVDAMLQDQRAGVLDRGGQSAARARVDGLAGRQAARGQDPDSGHRSRTRPTWSSTRSWSRGGSRTSPAWSARRTSSPGTDCGFSQFWDSIRVHPDVQWAKLRRWSTAPRSRARSCGEPRSASRPVPGRGRALVSRQPSMVRPSAIPTATAPDPAPRPATRQTASTSSPRRCACRLSACCASRSCRSSTSPASGWWSASCAIGSA